MSAGSRHGARRLLVQALYQMQITDHPAEDILEQFRHRDEYPKVDRKYFDALLPDIAASVAELNELIGEYGELPAEQIDPVEKAVFWLALTELRDSDKVPAKVVINEAIELTKMFGAEGGYKYVNGVLDKAAEGLRNAG